MDGLHTKEMELLVCRYNYPGHGLDIAGGNMFALKVPWVTVGSSIVDCRRFCVSVYMCPLRELLQSWSDRKYIIIIIITQC